MSARPRGIGARSRRAGGARGFTLLELLVGLVLFSLIMTALVGGLRTLGNSATAAEARVQESAERRAVAGFLRRSLATLAPVSIERPGQPPQAAFRGEPERLVFVAPPPAQALAGGLHWLDLRWTRNGGFSSIELCMQPFVASRELPPACNDGYPVVQQVDGFELTYLDAANGVWSAEWNPDDGWPQALRIRIRSEGRYWPDIVVALPGAPA